MGVALNLPVPDETRVRLLKLKEIPPPPALSRELIRLAGDEEAEILDVIKVVQQSPELASLVLNWANSAYYGERNKVTSVKDAIIRVLGLAASKSLLLAVSLTSTFDARKIPFFPLEKHWFLSVSTAAIAQSLASRLTVPEPLATGTVYSAGLLHNLGMLGLVHVFPAELKAVFFGDPNLSLNVRVHQILGISPSLAGAWLGKRWGLPEELVNTLNFHDDCSYEGDHWPLVRLVGLASKLAECHFDGKNLSDLSSEFPFEGLVRIGDIFTAVSQLEDRLGELKTFAQFLM
ncbi:MAG: HDOD domain-containing protein [Deltaproteobacteria bacterium]|nr:HDOD domain-containing protein [Deltaproteobacteria bacterium]